MEAPPELASDLHDEEHDYYGLAYLDFADSRYIVKKECVIIGRAPEHHLTLAEVPDQPQDASIPPSPLNERKRKRSDVDGDGNVESREASPGDPLVFQGGLGGPQEHVKAYFGEDAEFIYITPPADGTKDNPPNLKAISKKHLRFVLQEDDQWRIDVLGRNGVVINNEFYPQGSHIDLEDGDSFWVADLHFSFNIPGLDAEEIGDMDEEENMNAALYDSSDSDSEEDSYDVLSEAEAGQEVARDEDDEDEEGDEEESPISTKKPLKLSKRDAKAKSKLPKKTKLKQGKSGSGAVQNESDSGMEADDKSDRETTRPKKPAKTPKIPKTKLPKGEKSDKKAAAGSEEANGEDEDAAPKKRGPGRPPKDGVMSKRARRALQKAAEADREDGEAPPAKVKKPRKTSESNEKTADGETKKPKKSKKAQANGTEVKESVEKADGEPVKKERAPTPPPREPSPKESDFQEHELQKPDKPYSVCLYNVLRESDRSLALPDIYQAFKKRWPYFRFRVDGDGWQSSIRHNLQSTKCLIKDGKAGKGHLWTVDPNVPLDNRANNRAEMSTLPHGYYGHPGHATQAMLSAQNQQIPIRAPMNTAFQNPQNMQQYHAYMQQNANGQRPQQQGPQQNIQHLQAPNNNSTSFMTGNQGQFSVNRSFVTTGPNAAGMVQQQGVRAQQQQPGSVQHQMSIQQQRFNPAGSNNSASATASNANSNQARPNVPQSGTLPNGQFGQSQVAAGGSFSPEKLHVFDQFRTRLLGMAQNDTQKRYYIEILDLGQAWCSQHSELGARYDGPRKDIGQIVKAFQEAWEGHLRKKNGVQGQSISTSSSPAPQASQQKPAPAQSNGVSATAPAAAASAAPQKQQANTTQGVQGTGASSTPASSSNAPGSGVSKDAVSAPTSAAVDAQGANATNEASSSNGGAKSTTDGSATAEAKPSEQPADQK